MGGGQHSVPFHSAVSLSQVGLDDWPKHRLNAQLVKSEIKIIVRQCRQSGATRVAKEEAVNSRRVTGGQEVGRWLF